MGHHRVWIASLLSLHVASVCTARLIYDTVHANFSQLAWSPEHTNVFLGSPSLIRAPDGALLASHDYFVQGVIPDRMNESAWEHKNDNCSVYRSVDNGILWEQVSERLPGTFWAQLFVHRGKIYLLGVHRAVSIVIRHGSTDGKIWSPPVALLNGSTYGAIFDVAPSPIIEIGGRLIHSLQLGGRHGVMSAGADSDLMDPASWAMSALVLLLAVSQFRRQNWPLHAGTNHSSVTFGEGAVVQGSDGGVRVLSRLGFTRRRVSSCVSASPRLPVACWSVYNDLSTNTACPATNKAAWFRL